MWFLSYDGSAAYKTVKWRQPRCLLWWNAENLFNTLLIVNDKWKHHYQMALPSDWWHRFVPSDTASFMEFNTYTEVQTSEVTSSCNFSGRENVWTFCQRIHSRYLSSCSKLQYVLGCSGYRNGTAWHYYLSVSRFLSTYSRPSDNTEPAALGFRIFVKNSHADPNKIPHFEVSCKTKSFWRYALDLGLCSASLYICGHSPQYI